MGRIVCNGLTRVSATEFKCSWDYNGVMDENTDRIHWLYHTNGANVDTGRDLGEVFHSPAHAQYSPVSIKAIGPNLAIPLGAFWPNTRVRATNTILDLAVNYNHVDGWNGEQCLVIFGFAPPKKPTVTLTRTQNVLSWVVKSNASEMGDNTAYNRQRTRYYIQRITRGQSWPNVPAYDNGGVKFTEDEKTVTHSSEPTVSPEVPVKVRIVARNDGFAGTSEAEVSEHVFSIPPKPTIVAVNNGGGMGGSAATLSVRSNSDDDWYPVEKFILERQVASACAPNGSWTKVGEYTNTAGSKALASIRDGQDARIPSVDQATWYRVRSVHDEDSNNTSSDIPVATYTNRPSAPTIQEAVWQSDQTIQMNVNKVSHMNVDTYVRVLNMSADTPTEVVPAYKVTDNLSSFMILDGGVAKHFDVDCVYKVEVFNKVSNEGEDVLVAYGDTPTSTVATTNVKGSASAVAKALLSTPEITGVTLNPSGKGVTLTWVTGVDELSMAYDEIGTLIEWTDADGGWQSTEAPKSHKRPDDGGNGGTVSIDGLTEGTEYKIRLRRYITLDGKDGYGTEVTTAATPWSTPKKPTLSAAGYVLPGGSVRYTWTFEDEGDTPQSAAALAVNGASYSIDGSAGSFVLDVPESMEGETLTATVRVAAKGGFSEPSDPVVTTVAERPTCTLALAGSSATSDLYGGHTVSALPLAVTVGGSGTSWRVRVTCNGGATSPEPEGGRELAAGEVAAYALVHGAGTHELDSSSILGGGNYDVECVCVDDTTGMESEPVTVGFTAVWATRATIPTGTVTIANGQATIVPQQGDGAAETETCRIWRKTADGYQLACEGALWGESHLDRVPPYGSDDLAYVIEAVSADGDHAWLEIPYTLAGTDARFTIGGETVSLPWNLQPKSSYRKGFERRSHMDGRRAGFWQPGVDRDWTCSSQFERGNVGLLDRVRRIGRYDGLVYVRGPRGVAFAANVDVDESLGFDSVPVDADMTCAEVADDGTYAIVPTPEASDGEGA